MIHTFRSTCLTALTGLAILAAAPAPAAAAYKYAHAEGEYMIELPAAPWARTLWADRDKIVYLDDPPKFGAVGETAYFTRRDPATGDVFDSQIIFLKANRDFLLNLTQERIKEELEYEFSELIMEDTNFSFSAGVDTLKWGVFSGFSVGRNNEVVHNIAHYLAGLDTITIFKVSYALQNDTFDKFYQDIAKSITYMGH